ncbi:DUF4232 domain-containing protein [Agromyces aureus]|uniref:DUF4232 domain-containing protein n=1 Tax=Agromyces aureus TaxID=453304 RepID=A0A191WD72_9MICO|nr:DUF4232 domain-containing protein [Agromyces aureus]ANJ26153.1 hypothetical protein ATC03_04820 [Agromyces aureus]
MRTSMIAAAGALALGLLLTGCAGSTPAPSTSPTPTGSPSSSATPTPTSTASTDPNAPAGQCADDALEVTVRMAPDGGSAGHTNSQVVFTNTGSNSCELRGAPGVSVLDASGAQLGAPADQSEPDSPPTITIAAGGTALATLSAVNIGTDGGPLADSCTVAEGTAYRVYPPHSFTAFDVTATVPACSNGTVWMDVMAVEAG